MFHPKSPFNNNDLNLDPDQFDMAMNAMIENGLVTSFTKNGVKFYQLTDIGYAVGQHLIADTKMAN